MTMILELRAEAIFSIICGLEARLEFLENDVSSTEDEVEIIKETIRTFKSLKVHLEIDKE